MTEYTMDQEQFNDWVANHDLTLTYQEVEAEAIAQNLDFGNALAHAAEVNLR